MSKANKPSQEVRFLLIVVLHDQDAYVTNNLYW